MKTIVFFLEESSAREMLQGILPKILPANVYPNYIIFEGKQDLEKNLVRKLRNWCLPDSVFVVIRDQDSEKCELVKRRLLDLCQKTGKKNVLVRVACRELESFYLGDIDAVEKGLGIPGIAARQKQSKFRKPDTLGNPYQELCRLTKGRYQKRSGSRSIAPHLRLEGNTSHSFNVLLSGIRGLLNNGLQ